MSLIKLGLKAVSGRPGKACQGRLVKFFHEELLFRPRGEGEGGRGGEVKEDRGRCH